MKSQKFLRLSVLLLFIIWGFYASAQNPVLTIVDPPAGNNNWRIVVNIAQDQQGFIWLATQLGLHRYDGYKYVSYYHNPEDSNSLAENRIVSMCVSKSGIIWLGLWTKGLDRFDPVTQTFTHFSHNPDDPGSLYNNTIPAITEDHEGNLWVGTHGGLHLFHPGTGKFTRYLNKPGDSTSLSNNQVRVLYTDKQGTLWVGTGSPFGRETEEGGGGLNRFHPETGTFTRYMHDPNNPGTLLDNKVRAILEDSRGNFWVGTKGDGLHTMDRKTGIFTRHRYDPLHPEKLSCAPIISTNSSEGVTFIHEDSAGAIWIGTYSSGLSRYDPVTDKINHFTSEPGNPIGLQTNFTWWAFTSKEGELWISSFSSSGIFYRTNPLGMNFTYQYTGASVYGMTKDSKGNLWVGTRKGLRIYEAGEFTKQNTLLVQQLPEELRKRMVGPVLESKAGDIWIGGLNGVWRRNPATGNFTHYAHNPKNPKSIGEGPVYAIFEDREGVLWIGTDTGGLNRMDPKNGIFTHFVYNPDNLKSIGSNNVRSIHEDRSGNLWIGSFNGFGLSKLNKSTGDFSRYFSDVQIGVINTQINQQLTLFTIFEDTSGKIWLGTNIGLFFYSPEIDNVVLFKDTLSGEQILSSIRGIQQDDQMNLWVNSRNGLMKIDPKGVLITTYGKEYGIDPGAITPLSSYKSRGGQHFFGDSTGFYTFHPRDIKLNIHPPQITFSDFKIFDKTIIPGSNGPLYAPIDQMKKIELAHDQNTFSVDFAGIHFTSPSQNQHFFMLGNYESTWKKPGTNLTASYYNLSPGNYVLRVKAASSEGVWAEKAITIVIHPPWWKTWWAFAIYLIAFALAVWRVHLFQKARTIRIEREKSRERELMQSKEIEKAYHELRSTQSQLIQSEKMASLGELTAGIAHEIQNPLNFVNNFSEVNQELLSEMNEEIEKGNLEEATSIAKAVIENEQKINHHGKRADAIVKGMLQHSRSSNGIKEPTDINALADEYLRLAYHGLRARDKSFNATMKTDLDENIGKVNVVPQDIGRVILNLITNAFYAVDVRKKSLKGSEILSGLDGYEPTVTVSTKKMNGEITISVKDNGSGIPPHIVDKIFQPFFTTKPAGEGTGLGLSMSYEIITKGHGGELLVETLEGEGSVFVIHLPI